MAEATSSTSPATVTLTWQISGLGSQTATCEITSTDSATPVITLDPCPKEGSRNATAIAFDEPRTVTYTMLVHTSLGVEATASTAFTASPAPGEPFNIRLTGLDSVDSRIAAAATTAAERWERVIVNGVPDVSTFPSWCQDLEVPLPTSVDDLLVQVTTDPIDGPGGTLAFAGPDCILLDGERAVTGVLNVDAADIGLSDEYLVTLMVHEIGHVLGIGTLWDNDPWGWRMLVRNVGTSDPRFIGRAAVAEWNALGGTGEVPIENTGGSGTAEAHWRASTFGPEVMIGWLYSGAPLSRVTIASLADIGYQVDLNQADPFTPSDSAAARPGARASGQTGRQIEVGRHLPQPGVPN